MKQGAKGNHRKCTQRQSNEKIRVEKNMDGQGIMDTISFDENGVRIKQEVALLKKDAFSRWSGVFLCFSSTTIASLDSNAKRSHLPSDELMQS